MGYIEVEEIRGYLLDQQVVCSECMRSNDSTDDVERQDIITDYDVDNDEGFYFCDRCNKRL